MIFAVPVLSEQAHARIVSVDDSEALAVQGCIKVYTGRDVPNNRIGFYHDHPVICDDKVRFYGDIVAVVAADTRESAQLAARRVKVEYEPLPLIETMEQSLSMERGKVHDQMDNNICHEIHYKNGDIEEAFSQCAHIVENTYTFQSVDHCFLEAESGLSSMEDGKLVVRAGSQNIFYDRSQIAEALNLPEDDVIVVAPYTGGAFGGKGDVSVQCLIGLVTLDTKRPCAMHFTREERFVNGVKRHPGRVRMKTGMSEEGIILAHEVDLLMDTGAYTVFGNVVLEIATECCTGPYRIPNIVLDAWNVYTNNGSNGAFRGFGAAQGCFPLEGQINALARLAGMDAIGLRLRNCLRQGETSGLGHTLLSDPNMYETLLAASEDELWVNRESYADRDGDLRSGVGFACGMKGYGIGVNDAPDYGFAQVAFSRDGRFKLTVGCNDLGQGSFTVMTALLAKTLKVSSDDIDLVCLADTRANLETGATASSRVSYAVGRAVVAASERLLGQLREQLAYRSGVEPDQLEAVGGGFLVKGQEVSFEDMARDLEYDMVQSARIRTAYSEEKSEGGLSHPHVLYSSNAQIMHALVDLATGLVHIDKVHAYVDVGYCINRLAVEGQSEGGIVMGISYALLEKLERRQGRLLNPSFSTYLIPTALDIPLSIENEILEFAEETGPYGAKGMAENATVPTAPAVVDAVNDALGSSITEIPVSPEMIISMSLSM